MEALAHLSQNGLPVDEIKRVEEVGRERATGLKLAIVAK